MISSLNISFVSIICSVSFGKTTMSHISVELSWSILLKTWEWERRRTIPSALWRSFRTGLDLFIISRVRNYPLQRESILNRERLKAMEVSEGNPTVIEPFRRRDSKNWNGNHRLQTCLMSRLSNDGRWWDPLNLQSYLLLWVEFLDVIDFDLLIWGCEIKLPLLRFHLG